MKAYRALSRGLAPSMVLHLLAKGEKTGYEVVTAMGRGGEAVLPLGEGGCYALLQLLEARGVVESRLVGGCESGERVYRLTRKGCKRLGREQERGNLLQRITRGER